MQKITQLLAKYNTEIKTVMTAVIGLVAVVFIALLLIKAMKALKDQAIGEAAKNFGFAILVALIAWIGITGVITLMNSMQPGNELGVSGGNFQLLIDAGPDVAKNVLSNLV